MSTKNIKNFYSSAIEQKKFSPEFWNELRKISTESELKSFIEGKVQPVAKDMGYDFSTAELLNYEEQMAKKITEKQLEAVSGGVNVKNLALGGIISLMAIGAGVVGATSSASAELSTEEISGSLTTLETEIGKEIEKPKIKEESKENKKSDQEQDDKEENRQKKLENTDLETVKATSNVNQLNTEETKKLTDEQKLYALKALNLQDAYAFLQSEIIKNLRLFLNISNIELDENGNRVYTADHGDAFTELLYMFYPSPTGSLNTNTQFKGRDSFAVYGGMSPEHMAKFCAILNDYRNGKINKNELDKILNSNFDFKKTIDEKAKQINKLSPNKKISNPYLKLLEDTIKFLKQYNNYAKGKIKPLTIMIIEQETIKITSINYLKIRIFRIALINHLKIRKIRIALINYLKIRKIRKSL